MLFFVVLAAVVDIVYFIVVTAADDGTSVVSVAIKRVRVGVCACGCVQI